MASSGYFSRVAWSGSELAYVYSNPATTDEILLQLYDGELTALGSALSVSGTTAGNDTRPSVVWTGSMYGITWMNDGGGDRKVLFSAVEPDGTVIDTGLVVAPEYVEHQTASMTWTGSEIGVMWERAALPSHELWFNRIGWCD